MATKKISNCAHAKNPTKKPAKNPTKNPTKTTAITKTSADASVLVRPEVHGHTAGGFIAPRPRRQESSRSEIYRRNQDRAFAVQAQLQAGNLVQVESTNFHPVDKAVPGNFAQSRNLTNLRRDSTLELVEKCWRNEIWRILSIELAGRNRKLGGGVPRLPQNVPDALDARVRNTVRCCLPPAFAAAKRRSRDRHPKQCL